jgi:hypothetical protein
MQRDERPFHEQLSAARMVSYTWAILFTVFLVWLTINVVGTVYFTKIPKPGRTPLLTTSVVLAWLIPALTPLNLASPIIYARLK